MEWLRRKKGFRRNERKEKRGGKEGVNGRRRVKCVKMYILIGKMFFSSSVLVVKKQGHNLYHISILCHS